MLNIQTLHCETNKLGKYIVINNQEYTRKLPRRKCYTLRKDTEDDLRMLTDTGLIGFGPGSRVSDVCPPELQGNKLSVLACKFLVICSSTMRKLLQDPFLPSSWMPRPQLSHCISDAQAEGTLKRNWACMTCWVNPLTLAWVWNLFCGVLCNRFGSLY